jgi:hypothetical protein
MVSTKARQLNSLRSNNGCRNPKGLRVLVVPKAPKDPKEVDQDFELTLWIG